MTQARCNSLPTLSTLCKQLSIGKQQNVDIRLAVCPLCDQKEVDDLEHFLLFCPSYQQLRNNTFQKITNLLRSSIQDSKGKKKIILTQSQQSWLSLLSSLQPHSSSSEKLLTLTLGGYVTDFDLAIIEDHFHFPLRKMVCVMWLSRQKQCTMFIKDNAIQLTENSVLDQSKKNHFPIYYDLLIHLDPNKGDSAF